MWVCMYLASGLPVPPQLLVGPPLLVKPDKQQRTEPQYGHSPAQIQQWRSFDVSLPQPSSIGCATAAGAAGDVVWSEL